MNFEEVVYFLTHLPESMCVNDLFHNIEPFMRNYPSTSENIKFKRRFSQVILYKSHFMQNTIVL